MHATFGTGTLLLFAQVGMMLGKPALDHYFEKFAERGVHHILHHHTRLSHFEHKFKLLPDVIMIALLVLLDVTLHACGWE